jgi:hypothetical protein
MTTLYLALVLFGIIFGSLIGMNEVPSLFLDCEMDADLWAREVFDNTNLCDAHQDAGFVALVELLASQTVFVKWSELKTPMLTRAATEALKLMGAAQVAQELGVYIELDLLSAATRPVGPVGPAGPAGPVRWGFLFNGMVQSYTRKDDARRGAIRALNRALMMA